MKYFAYGSNMSIARLRARVPSAQRLGIYFLERHLLRFHKVSKDGSGKCDAFHTDNPKDSMVGALYEIDAKEKLVLDGIEGVGHGYELKTVRVNNASSDVVEAFMYAATDIDNRLKPYGWYLNHVIQGAVEIDSPIHYLRMLEQIESVADTDLEREAFERAIHR